MNGITCSVVQIINDFENISVTRAVYVEQLWLSTFFERQSPSRTYRERSIFDMILENRSLTI